jgi:glycine/D-amino acid oxidase-like deaminating enzyme/nitrite reductase/ring-hydroxylating ferredoxin subunit
VDTTSVWRGTAPKAAVETIPTLQEEIATDVVIVGGGITGVTLALNLAEQGIPVVLLEAHDVGFGSTGNSTGNLYETVSRGIQRILDRWDKDVAHAATVARRAAVDEIERRVQKYGIGCEFRRCALYRYATSEEAKERVEKEYQASLDAGMKVRQEKNLPTPFHPPHGQVMVLDNQAQFHPQAYVRELARQAAGQGCRIFENSAILELDTDQRVVRTARGKVTAKEIVLATHTPIGLHLVQAEMVVNREYGLATRVARDFFPPGIFWGSGVDRISARSLDVDDETYLICVGEEHKTGQEDAKLNLDRLEASATAHFHLREIKFRWSAQNYSAADALPYIGRDTTECFIATGFETDGLTWGTVAASIIADEIIGRDNLFAPLVKASRFSPVKGAQGLIEENVAVMKSFIKDYVTDRPEIPLSQLMPGHGAIVKIAGESLAAYLDPNGTLIAVSPVCTHMKCKVHWNGVEKSWDCPCHGSRFAPDGTVIEGPATAPLERHFLQNAK